MKGNLSEKEENMPKRRAQETKEEKKKKSGEQSIRKADCSTFSLQ